MPQALLLLLRTLATSKRVQGTIAAIIVAIAHKHIPMLADLTTEEVLGVVAAIVSIVISDGLRPIDPAKAARQLKGEQ